ncbi:MAG: hypothetical protein ACK5MW_00360 [Enterococcus sp.]
MPRNYFIFFLLLLFILPAVIALIFGVQQGLILACYFIITIALQIWFRAKNRRKNQELNYLWELAAKLHYTEKDLQAFTTLSQMDLVATRPENRTYLPSDQLVKPLIAKLEAQLQEESTDNPK